MIAEYSITYVLSPILRLGDRSEREELILPGYIA
jgi:hypothetical protein